MQNIILVAGATGNLGGRIVQSLLEKGAVVRVVVRSNSDPEKIAHLKQLGAVIFKVEDWTLETLTPACKGVACVVSALAGLRAVVIDAQKILLDAALAAGVPRFIPSDYSLDFTRFSDGENRNLDLRREFHTYLDQKPIAATSIFNGAFMDMIVDQMPFLLLKQKMVLYWGNPDHPWGFTTVDNTANYTAHVALDPSTPRYLRIAGDLISPKRARTVVNQVIHQKFRLFRPGGQGFLGILIKIIRRLAPGENELYPPWQGMQYMHNMIDERSNIDHLDNDRYPEMRWTTVQEFLEGYLAAKGGE
jgi:hypothetical protein